MQVIVDGNSFSFHFQHISQDAPRGKMKKTAVLLATILVFGSALACVPSRRRPSVPKPTASIQKPAPKPAVPVQQPAAVPAIRAERFDDRLQLHTRSPFSGEAIVWCDQEPHIFLYLVRGYASFYLSLLAGNSLGDWATCKVVIKGTGSVADLSSYIPAAKALREKDRLLIEQDRKAREARDQVLMEEARAADAKKALWEKKHRFDDWGSFCEDLDPLRSDTCADEGDSYSREICMEGVKSYRKAGHTFKVPVLRTVTYEPQKKRFKVVVRHRLWVYETEGDWDQCWRDLCYQSMLSTLRFKATSGKTSYAKWVKRISAAFSPHLKPWKTFYVREDQIENPEGFDEALVVEALVKFKDENWVYVGDWYGIDNLQVKVVGLRARVGYEWGRVLISARGQRLRTGCD